MKLEWRTEALTYGSHNHLILNFSFEFNIHSAQSTHKSCDTMDVHLFMLMVACILFPSLKRSIAISSIEVSQTMSDGETLVSNGHQCREAKRHRLFSTFGFGCETEAYTAEVKRHYFMPLLSTRGIFESLLPRFWFNRGILIIKKNCYKTHTSLTFFSLTHMGPTPHTFFLSHVALSHLTHKTHTINFYTRVCSHSHTLHTLSFSHSRNPPITYSYSLTIIHSLTKPTQNPHFTHFNAPLTLSTHCTHDPTLTPHTHTHTHTNFSQYPFLHNSQKRCASKKLFTNSISIKLQTQFQPYILIISNSRLKI